jgi:hypothetical protein
MREGTGEPGNCHVIRISDLHQAGHNVAVVEFGFELSLVFCLLLNAAVFGSAWFFARRRLTASWSQALLDALLIGYGVQYVSVGLAGMLGCLDSRQVSGFAMCLVVGSFAGGWKIPAVMRAKPPLRDRLIVLSTGLFVIGFVLAFAHFQAVVPVTSNDALTYHFPAAAQWMQQGRIGLFQTWFFNPANTWSPLAGSVFITWLMLPFGNDLLARFVEVPVLLCVGVAVFRLCGEMGVRPAVSALVAASAVLSRPIFTPCMMGKDDLFVAFFFVATLVAMSPDRARERFGCVRFGIALGLLLATKYTALLGVPMLVLARSVKKTEPGRVGPVRGEFRGGKPRLCWSLIAAFIAIILAGPWYLRNWITTGNPLFPLAIPHVFRGLFTTSRSDAFHSWPGVISTAIGGEYGLPMALAIVLAFAVVVSLLFFRSFRKQPIFRACVLGPLIGLALFYWRSPFPEVRFLLPVFLLLFACGGVAIDRIFGDERFAIAVAAMLVGVSLLTLFKSRISTADFAATALMFTAIGIAGYLWANGRRVRWVMLGAAGTFAFAIFTFINWAAYCRNYLSTKYDADSVYAQPWIYPDLTPLWGWVNTHLPADARVAYTNLYYVYPLQGNSLRRRLVYVPTRPGVSTMADLPWLGDRLPGERIVPAAGAATVGRPDLAVWLVNLRKSGCDYLIIGRFGHGGVAVNPPEAGFAAAHPGHFSRIFSCDAGDVYLIRRP